MAQNKTVLKFMKNDSLMIPIMVLAFKDHFPFGDLAGVVDHHLGWIGKGYLSGDLLNEMIRRKWVSTPSNLSADDIPADMQGKTLYRIDDDGIRYFFSSMKYIRTIDTKAEATLFQALKKFLNQIDASNLKVKTQPKSVRVEHEGYLRHRRYEPFQTQSVESNVFHMR